jgi:hypothetical protein
VSHVCSPRLPSSFKAGLPDFSRCNIPKRAKIYQITIKCTKCTKIYQHLPLQAPPKFTQIWIFGLKIYHLATLIDSYFWAIRVT